MTRDRVSKVTQHESGIWSWAYTILPVPRQDGKPFVCSVQARIPTPNVPHQFPGYAVDCKKKPVVFHASPATPTGFVSRPLL